MQTITVRASTEYAVMIGAGLLDSLGAQAAAIIPGRKAIFVSDRNVWPLYGLRAAESLTAAGFSVAHFLMDAGEDSKSPENYLRLLCFLAEQAVTREDCILALGGGVVGDLAGFAAATYLRGIAYIQIPTTLLAMVDSSVGGKTAINLPAGKNLAGSFWPPKLVLCDTDTLQTLPEAIFTEGCAEVIKYGILFDEELFSLLERWGKAFPREEIIAQCIQWKKHAVQADEFDAGMRQLLNLGHTIGHSIEKASHYTVSHGAAVAIGISMTARSAAALGCCSADACGRMTALLQKFDLPTSTVLPASQLAEFAMRDKKRFSDTLTLILPATIGCCRPHPWPVHQLESFIKAGI